MHIDITALYCCLDDFVKLFESWQDSFRIEDTQKRRRRTGKLSQSEMLLIMILFHGSPFRNFKDFYQFGVCQKYRHYFKELPSYERFVILQPRLLLPLAVLLHMLMRQSKRTGLYVVDSTSLKVCHNKRIFNHKVFKGMAERGKTTMGWFFGFKLHIIINEKGELIAVQITSGNVDDRHALGKLTRNLAGKLLADRGYISAEWFNTLWKQGLHLLVGIRKNMKNYLMPIYDKLLLRKRFIVETVFGVLKQNMGLEHSRHRSPMNAMVHILSCLVNYCFKPNKPKMNFDKTIKLDA